VKDAVPLRIVRRHAAKEKIVHAPEITFVIVAGQQPPQVQVQGDDVGVVLQVEMML
jgi:hypothetical protein